MAKRRSHNPLLPGSNGRGSSSGSSSSRGGSGSSSRGSSVTIPVSPDDAYAEGGHSYRDHRWSSKDPENVWAPDMEALNLLNSAGFINDASVNGVSPDTMFNQLFQYLLGIGSGDKHSLNADQMTALFNQYLQYYMTKEARGYEESRLEESRLYNNPTNELARLMGSGISRDAALAIMQGAGAGSAAGAGSSAVMTPTVTPGAGMSDQMANAASANAANTNSVLNIINTAVGCAQALGQMVDSGINSASALQNLQMLQAQNYITQDNLQGFQSADAVVKMIQQLQLNGSIEPSDVDSWQNADDVYKWLYDHMESKGVKPLLDSGDFQRTFGSIAGREQFNRYWHNMRDSRDYGKQVDQLLRSNDLTNDLKEMDLNTSYLTYYGTMYDVVLKDQALNQAYLDYMIDVENWEQEQYETDIYAEAAYEANIQKRINTRIFEDSSNGGIGSKDAGTTGIQLMSFADWHDLRQAHIKALAEHDFGEDYWTKYFQSHVKTAKNLAFLAEHQSEIMSQMYSNDNPGMATFLSFMKTLFDSGAIDALKTGGDFVLRSAGLFKTPLPVKR